MTKELIFWTKTGTPEGIPEGIPNRFLLTEEVKTKDGNEICEILPVVPETSDEECGPDCKFRLKFVITKI